MRLLLEETGVGVSQVVTERFATIWTELPRFCACAETRESPHGAVIGSSRVTDLVAIHYPCPVDRAPRSFDDAMHTAGSSVGPGAGPGGSRIVSSFF